MSTRARLKGALSFVPATADNGRMPEDILPRIEAKYVAAAIKLLPAPSKSPDAMRSFNYNVPGVGLVRFEFTRTMTMNGKFRQWAWTPSSAHAVTMTFD